VEAVLENVEERHGFAGEPMHEQGFKLSLKVVPDHHGDSHLLIKGEGLALAVDLLLEQSQKSRNNDGPKVLNQEHLQYKVIKERGFTNFQEI